MNLIMAKKFRALYVVSCPASFHSHAKEKSLVKCLFNFCSVNDYVMLVVYVVFNVAMCANGLMFARWQVNETDCLSFRHHTQTMGYLSTDSFPSSTNALHSRSNLKSAKYYMIPFAKVMT